MQNGFKKFAREHVDWIPPDQRTLIKEGWKEKEINERISVREAIMRRGMNFQDWLEDCIADGQGNQLRRLEARNYRRAQREEKKARDSKRAREERDKKRAKIDKKRLK